MVSLMDGGDWISLAGVIVAAIAAVIAWTQARAARAAQVEAAGNQARAETEARKAREAAERAAVAEAESAAAATRAADALEAQNKMAEAQAALEEGVPWRLQHQRGDTYELFNETPTPKFDVRVAGDTIPTSRGVQRDRVDGRSSLTFMAISAWNGGSDDIEVRWHRREDLSDEEQVWTGTRPPRPPRERLRQRR
jgi:hypothetical protein